MRISQFLFLLFLQSRLAWPQAYPPPPEDPPDLTPLESSSPFISPLMLNPDPQGRISLDVKEAVRYARASNPALLASYQRLRSSYWAYQSVSSLPPTQITAQTFPGTNVAGSNPGGNNPSGAGAGFATYTANGETDTIIQVSQPFWPLGSFTTAQDLARFDYQIAFANSQISELNLRKSTQDAFFALLAAQENQKIASENLLLAEKSHYIAQRRQLAGAGPRLDLLDAKVQLSRAQFDLVTSQTRLKTARALLAPLIGLSSDYDLVALGRLTTPPLKLQYESLLTSASRSPVLVAAQLALNRSRTAVTNAEQQGNATPTFTYIRDLPTQTDQYQIGFQFPLDWGQIRNQVRQNEEAVVEQEQNLQAVQLALSSRLKTAYEAYLSSCKNASEYEEKVLQPSEESNRITQYGYQRGAVPYLRLLNSQINLMNVRKRYVSLLQLTLTNLDALEAASGQIFVVDSDEPIGSAK